MSPRIKICKEDGCVSAQTASGFCRLHYLKNWKQIRAEKEEKAKKVLERYVENIAKTTEHKSSKRSEVVSDFDGGAEESSYSRDEFDNVLENLGYREDLDRLIDGIKIDKDF